MEVKRSQINVTVGWDIHLNFGSIILTMWMNPSGDAITHKEVPFKTLVDELVKGCHPRHVLPELEALRTIIDDAMAALLKEQSPGS